MDLIYIYLYMYIYIYTYIPTYIHTFFPYIYDAGKMVKIWKLTIKKDDSYYLKRHKTIVSVCSNMFRNGMISVQNHQKRPAMICVSIAVVELTLSGV